MLSRFFHNWERRLASVTKDRVVRPFEWGLDWLGFDAAQTWVLERSPLTNSAVIATYVVDALTPMEGSASL